MFIVEVKIGALNPVVVIPAVPSTPSDGGNHDDDSAAEEGAEYDDDDYDYIYRLFSLLFAMDCFDHALFWEIKKIIFFPLLSLSTTKGPLDFLHKSTP